MKAREALQYFLLNMNLLASAKTPAKKNSPMLPTTTVLTPYYYTPAEDMTDVLVEFTFAQGVVVSGLEDWNQPGNSTNRSKVMNFSACEIVSWTVGMTGNCGGNLWTDFKVNGQSKKGGLLNIEMAC